MEQRMTNLITEARELIEALHAGVYDDEYIGTGAYLMLDELCAALEKAEAEIERLNRFKTYFLDEIYGEGLERNTADMMTRIEYLEEELVDGLMYCEWMKDKLTEGGGQ